MARIVWTDYGARLQTGARTTWTDAGALQETAAAVLSAGMLVRVWSGSAWVVKPPLVWLAGAWAQKPVRVWSGSAWVP